MSSWMTQIQAESLTRDGVLATIAPAVTPNRIRHNHPMGRGTSAFDCAVYPTHTDN